MNVLVVSFATPGPYVDEMQKLCASCGEFMVEAYLSTCSGIRSWREAVSFKPTFVYATLHDLKHEYDAVLWTDADSVFRRPPDWSVFDRCDVAWHRFKRSRHVPVEDLTGTMFFRRTPSVLEFVDEWIVRTKAYIESDTPEQRGLRDAWGKGWGKLVHVDPGPEWCWIFDDFPEIYGKDRHPVVEHFQASRRLKR